jgi:hypothetical protein
MVCINAGLAKLGRGGAPGPVVDFRHRHARVGVSSASTLRSFINLEES